MFCGKCGAQLSDQATVCQYCGAPVEADDSYPVRNADVQVSMPKASGNMKGNGKKKSHRKLILVISLILIVAMIAAIVVIVMVKTPLTADKANQEYLTLLDENYEDIVLFEKSSGVGSVAFFDMNGSGIDDMVYVTMDKGGITHLNIAFDSGNKIITDRIEVGKVFELFMGKKGNIFRLFSRSSTPIIGQNYRLETLSDLFLKDDKITLTNQKERYHNSDTNTVSYDPPVERAENYSGNESSYNGGDEEGSIILIDPVEPVPGIPLPGDPGNTSISTGVEEARGRLESGSTSSTEAHTGSAVVDPTAPTMPDQTEPQPTEPTIVDVDPASISETLNRFFYSFIHYRSTDDSQYHREFDCTNLSNCYDRLAHEIANAYSCFNFRDYPGIDYTGGLTDPDPLGKFSMGHTLWKEDDVIWIMKNIFHIGDGDIRPMIDAALERDAEYFYEYESGGVTYLCAQFGAKGDSPEKAVLDKVRFDGERYYVIYHFHADYSATTGYDTDPFYAEVSEVEIGGVKYWTMYKHSEIIPELPASGTGSVSGVANGENEVFAEFSGGYLFSSGAGGWSTQIELKGDGTFTGEFHARERTPGATEYDSIDYAAYFSGKCTTPQKVNDYTYTFTITDIVYEHELLSSEIVSENGSKVKRVYSKAQGFEDGVNTVYAYTPDAPVDQLPSSFVSGINNMRWDERDEPTLLYYCLYLQEYGSAWKGPEG